MSIWVRNHRGQQVKPARNLRPSKSRFSTKRPLAHLPIEQQFAIYEAHGNDHTALLHPSFENKFGTSY